MKIAVYGRLLKEKDIEFIQILFNRLMERGFAIAVHEEFYSQLAGKIKFSLPPPTFQNSDDIVGHVDYMFSLGGDGTLLDTVPIVKNSKIPILGINIGRLGFLSSIGTEELDKALDAIENGTFVVDTRTLVHLDADIPLFNGVNYALNECTIHKKDTSSLMVIHTYINGEFLNSYWADGLIVATPTGSTGYSLSCGGPIIFPGSGNFVITPVAPHNLNVRPIVVPDDAVISFDIEGRADSYFVTLDSRTESIDDKVRLAVRKEDFDVKLIRLSETNFLTTLRNKLMLGIDKRN